MKYYGPGDLGFDFIPTISAILTISARKSAFIFAITRLRWAFTFFFCDIKLVGGLFVQQVGNHIGENLVFMGDKSSNW